MVSFVVLSKIQFVLFALNIDQFEILPRRTIEGLTLLTRVFKVLFILPLTDIENPAAFIPPPRGNITESPITVGTVIPAFRSLSL